MGRKRKEEHFVEHELLDDKCRKYIEDAINSYHQIGSEFLLHSDFLQFWYNHIWEKPTPQNALLGAIRFFDEKKVWSKISKSYFEKLRRYYNCVCDITKPNDISEEDWENSDKIKRFKEGKETLQWIKTLLSQNPPEIVRINVDWLPNLVNDSWSDYEKVLASEISFGWKIARLWQLLKNRNKEFYIKSFFGMDIKEEESNSNMLSGTVAVPTELTESLKNIEAEKIEFFEKYLHFFSPAYLSGRELCNFWKKACISSIEGKPISNAYRQPIDKIWLLARFFNIHFYSLDFVQSNRGLPPRLAKQIESLQNPTYLMKMVKEDSRALYKRTTHKWGSKGLPAEEVFVTKAGKKDFRELEKKANDIYTNYQMNRAENLYKKALPLRTGDSVLGTLSFFPQKDESEKQKKAREDFLCAFQKGPSDYIFAFLIISFMDYVFSQFDRIGNPNNLFGELDDDEDEKDEDEGREEKKETVSVGQVGFAFMWVSSILSWSLKHEKNLFLISSEDIDKEMWDVIIRIIPIVMLFCAIRALSKSQSVSTSATDKGQTL